MTSFHISDPTPSFSRDSDFEDPAPAAAEGSVVLSTAVALRARVQQDPYATLGIAVGLGLLVGGGMWRLVARSLLGLGTRLAVSTVVTSLLDRTSTEHHRRSP